MHLLVYHMGTLETKKIKELCYESMKSEVQLNLLDQHKIVLSKLHVFAVEFA